ncbi:MAG: hypothetical protein ACKOAD_07945 [Gammaproteobacteria bacterium]
MKIIFRSGGAVSFTNQQTFLLALYATALSESLSPADRHKFQEDLKKDLDRGTVKFVKRHLHSDKVRYDILNRIYPHIHNFCFEARGAAAGPLLNIDHIRRPDPSHPASADETPAQKTAREHQEVLFGLQHEINIHLHTTFPALPGMIHMVLQADHIDPVHNARMEAEPRAEEERRRAAEAASAKAEEERRRAAEAARAKAEAEAARAKADEERRRAAEAARAKAAAEAEAARAAAEARRRAAEDAARRERERREAEAARAAEEARREEEARARAAGAASASSSAAEEPEAARIRREVGEERAPEFLRLFRLKRDNPSAFSAEYKTSSKEKCREMRRVFGF